MQHVLVLGAGKIGSLVAFLLAHSNRYHVALADVHEAHSLQKSINELPHFDYHVLDVNDTKRMIAFIRKNNINALISSLPFHTTIAVAKLAAQHQLPYFDLTEDVKTTEAIESLAAHSKTIFVPQCGLAPGFISIVAHDLMQHFQSLDTVKMRVGALPLDTSNALHYALTWSTDGLINEYGNPCRAIEDGKIVATTPLEGLESINLDGANYEAFNTSGGIGSLVKTYQNKVSQLNYKTIRYPGHCEKMKFLMNDLKLNEDRDTLKRILEHAIPRTNEDLVLVYVSVSGMQDGQFIEESYVKKFHASILGEHHWSAIQSTTASSLCAVADIVLQDPEKYHGMIHQEDFSLDELINNEFGRYFSS